MSDQKNIILYMHAGSGNHGCEAIANTLCAMLSTKARYKKDNIHLITYRKYEDDRYTLPKLCTIVQERSFDKHKIAHVAYYIYRKITGDRDSFMRFRFAEALKIKADVAISIGGDNYCYDSMLADLSMSNNVFNACGMKTALVGCSVEPELMKRSDIYSDLNRYHTIIARESITYDALKECFGDNKNIYLVPDPAFTLPVNDKNLDAEYVEFNKNHNTVGINLSPIAQESEATPGVTLKSYKNLIDYICEETDMNIAFIPHVIWPGNDDRTPINELYDYTCEKGYDERVYKVEDSDAETLKGYISTLRFFVGARTHSTIAAYSTCVPTLVVGYSVKARGIAKDLFPQYEPSRLVLQVQELQNIEQLKDCFLWIMDNEENIRNQLGISMPKYISEAFKTVEIINEIN